MKLELVSRTEGVGLYENLSQGEMVEAVARHGKKKDYGKLIRFLMKHKHWSPLEHVHFTFRIETSRDISAQMIRHRSFHWQELSQRYDEIVEFMPVELRKQGKNNRQVGEEPFDPIYIQADFGYPHVMASEVVDMIINRAHNVYKGLLELGVAKECARRILPMCSKTVVHMTGNLRDFLGYLNVRCEESTQKEHREVAIAIGEELEKEFPELKEMNWRTGQFM
jgi:thymidylate synthase (FAD)